LNKKTETKGAYEQDEQLGEEKKQNKNVNSDYLIACYYYYLLLLLFTNPKLNLRNDLK
jgi:hypothetical protein